MRKVKASELRPGDVFYRDAYRDPAPSDWRYTVRSLQRYPLKGYFGETHDRVAVEADNHIAGPQKLDLGVDELVWVLA